MYALLTVVAVRLLSIGLREGYHPVRSRSGWQLWATERLMDGARNYLFPLYASLLTPAWLRLLGAKVGRGTEISTVLLIPKFTVIEDGAFLADDTMVASYELGGGWIYAATTTVGRRAFLGNSGITQPGRRVPEDGLVAVLSAAPPKAKRGSSWLGSPPMRLRRRPAETDAARTYEPPWRLKAMRATVESWRLVPVMVTVAIGLAVLGVLQALTRIFGIWCAALCGGLVLLAAGGIAAVVTVAAKWLLVGRIRAGEFPLWSSFVWRNELADTFVETVAAPWFARAASGTPALNLWLRALGAKIGRGAWCESYWLPEADLVTLGRGSTVNRGCVVQTHLFHDRIMRMDAVVLEPGSTLGPHGVALPSSRLGAGVTVGPASLVVRGDEVPPIDALARQSDQAMEGRRPGQDRQEVRARRRGHRGVKSTAKKAAPRKVSRSAPQPVIDPYLPKNGNFGYRVSRYELDLEYKVAINRLSGSATITAATLTELTEFTLDLSDAMTVSKVLVNGKRAAHFDCRERKLRVRLSSKLAIRSGDVDRRALPRFTAADPVVVG